MTITRVYLVRHGETDANRNGIIQGHLDTPLNEPGTEQARLVGKALSAIQFNEAYSSDLSRAVQTADAILEHHTTVELCKQKELRERYMGELQGKLLLPSARLVTDNTIETGTAFTTRATSWWNQRALHRTASFPPRDTPYHILVVTHGGFIRTLVKNLIQSRKARCDEGVVIWKCFNSSVTIIEVGNDRKGIIMKYADISHLGAMADVVESNADEVTA